MNEHLKAYIDGELPAEQARQMEQALQKDAALRQEFDHLRRITSTMREASVTPAVAGLDKTLDALKARQPMKRGPLLRFAPAIGLAFTACLALVIVGRMNGAEPTFNDEIPMPAPKHQPNSHRAAAFSADQDVSAAAPVLPETQSVVVGAGKADGTLSAPASVGGPQRQSVGWATGGGRARFGKDNGLAAGNDYLQEGSSVKDGSVMPGTPRISDASAKQIVKTAQLVLTVQDGKATVDAATRLASKINGFIESSDLTGDDEQGMTGTLTLRIPVAKFDEAMTDLQKLGKVTGVSSNGQDVTGAVADDAARLAAMKVQEQAYLKILDNQAKHIDDILAVKDRLDSVQQDIESLTAELKTMQKEAAMSTITLTINQKAAVKTPVAAGPVKDDWINKTWGGAWSLLAAAGKTITQALIYFVVFCPVWIPLVVLANMLTRRLRQPA